jgi:glycosyltransferase involved in cell wall biosynthesis
VHRFAVDPQRRLAYAYCEPDIAAADNFRGIVEKVTPGIVHLHAHTSAVSEILADVAHAAGAKVVVTYHTPTASCARGTMMLFGEAPCDGEIKAARCAACALEGSGAPPAIGNLLASLPRAAMIRFADLPFEAAPLNGLRMPGLILRRGERFNSLLAKADAVVAVCQWVQKVLEHNHVPASKIMLSRQGISCRVNHAPQPPHSGRGLLRIAYMGRLDRTKGVDLLIAALRLRPDSQVLLDIYAVVQPGADDTARALHRIAADDRRVRILPSVQPDEVIKVMGNYDLIAIPSRGLETGPLVALEAFAAGVPVLGANLGGIAELVRDGFNGILLTPSDPNAWADGLDRLAHDPDSVARLRQNIRPPRTMDDVADDMSTLYDSLVGSSS